MRERKRGRERKTERERGKRERGRDTERERERERERDNDRDHRTNNNISRYLGSAADYDVTNEAKSERLAQKADDRLARHPVQIEVEVNTHLPPSLSFFL